MTPETALLLARFRLAVQRRPDLLSRPPWYRVEGGRVREIARRVGADPDRAVQAAAVLSPAVRWEDLVRRLPGFLVAYVDGYGAPPRFPGYRRNVERAWAILAGRALPTGPKVSRFARNLAGDERPVTVDRWAARAAGLPENGGVAWYRRIEGAYRELADLVGLPPSRVQAILWVAVRDRIVPWGPLSKEGPQDAPGSTIARKAGPRSRARHPSHDATHAVYGQAAISEILPTSPVRTG